MLAWRRWLVALAIVSIFGFTVMLSRRHAPTHRRVRPHYATYWDKPVRYLVLDAFILASPVNAILAFVFWLDPAWRERPEGWNVPGRVTPMVRRVVRNSLITICTFALLAFLGLAIYAVHVMDLIP
jgi:hypothetical protein